MRTPHEVVTVVNQCRFSDWTFIVSYNEDRPYMQLLFDSRCSITGEVKKWKSRKWALSYHMTDSEIVQTAFKAVLTAMEHEIREQFTFQGQPIFGPHFDVYKLVKLCKEPDHLDVREEI